MSSQQAIDNLNYATDLAKAGQQAPLVGGPIGLMWGLLLTVTLGTHWGIITGKLPFEIWHLGFLWVFFSIIGGVASAILSRTLKQKPSFHSTANQIEQSVWLMFSIGHFPFLLKSSPHTRVNFYWGSPCPSQAMRPWKVSQVVGNRY